MEANTLTLHTPLTSGSGWSQAIFNRDQAGPEFQGEMTSPCRKIREKLQRKITAFSVNLEAN